HSKRPDAPVDRELLVLRVEDGEGRPVAHAVNFAAHPTMLPAATLKFSPDYPGALCALVEKETGAPCLFLQGAAGDLSTKPAAGEAGPEKFGQALGREVLALTRATRCDPAGKAVLKVREDDFAFASRLDVNNPLVADVLSRAFFPELIAFYQREY